MEDTDNLVLASFDIESLYTNIPLAETINIVMNQMDSNLIGLPNSLFKNLLELSVYNNLFMFDNKFYRQLDGLGMGLPLSPTLANIFLCYHEKKWLQECPAEFKPLMYKRYVDDTIVAFREQAHVERFLGYLNSKHSNINFTCEPEKNKAIPFLDCLITREEGKFSTSVFRKDTFTGLGLSFFSHCSFKFKTNSIKTLLSRAYNISRNMTEMSKELNFLRKYFIDNGYPAKLFFRQVRHFIARCKQTPTVVHTCEKKSIFCSLNYNGYQSEKMKAEIDILVKKYFPQFDMHIILVNKFNIASLFKFKERLPTQLLSSVVYKFSCAHCASGTYVGSTIRATHMRVAEHRGRSYRTGEQLENPPKSAIRDHALKCGKTVSIGEFSILAQEKNELHLRILESLYIRHQKANLNEVKSAFPLKIAC